MRNVFDRLAYVIGDDLLPLSFVLTWNRPCMMPTRGANWLPLFARKKYLCRQPEFQGIG
jgi:hypothetical protein